MSVSHVLFRRTSKIKHSDALSVICPLTDTLTFNALNFQNTRNFVVHNDQGTLLFCIIYHSDRISQFINFTLLRESTSVSNYVKQVFYFYSYVKELGIMSLKYKIQLSYFLEMKLGEKKHFYLTLIHTKKIEESEHK